jgi:hypothetical protein
VIRSNQRSCLVWHLYPSKPASAADFLGKNQENPRKIGKISKNPRKTCGNRAFPIDFAYLKAAL